MKENDSLNQQSSEKNKLVNISGLTDESLYIIKIELEQGKPETINITQDSNPVQIAYKFCHKHNLEYDSLEYLCKKIKNIKEKHNEKK